MICDAHVHVGWYNCRGNGGLRYFSPRRVFGVLNRCGVAEWIVSSTSAQADGITIEGLLDEAREIKRIAGKRAHLFCWLTWNLYRDDPSLNILDCGMYEGIKLHEIEGRWVARHKQELDVVLDYAREHELPVQFHSGIDMSCRPMTLMEVAARHPKVRFDFAHCRLMPEMAAVMGQCYNVWTDTAYLSQEDFGRLHEYDWYGRLMFGTDIPVWQTEKDMHLTRRYRWYVRSFKGTGMNVEAAFGSFLQTKKERK